jgi:hypothetical protein
MVSEWLLSEAVEEFLEYSVRKSGQIRYSDHDICHWGDDNRLAGTYTISIPSTREWIMEPPDAASKVDSLVEAIVSDDDIPLIQSRSGVAKAFNRLIREIRIESNRGNTEELRNEPDFYKALFSEKAKVEYIAPIIGLSFDEDIQITEDLAIRRLNNFEKELMFNSKALGGGSVTLRRGIQVGSLTHAAVYEHSTPVEDGWKGSIGLMSEIDDEIRGALENLKIALRLSHTEGFQMSIRYIVDKTFYPAVISAHETHGSATLIGVVEPEPVSDTDKIVECYGLVSEANEDEGLRVAIDRFES